jgi:hypothetical protein
MTDRPSLAQLATDALKNEPLAEARPEPVARAEAIASVARALAARQQRARRNKFLVLGAIAAAAAASALFLARARSHGPGGQTAAAATSVVHAPSSATALSPGDQIASASGGSVVLATGTRLVMEETSALEVKSAGTQAIFDMRSGRVRFEVAKLATGDRFVVRTVDSEVEVRGTVFSVAVVPPEARCGKTVTRVNVSEGVVVVRHDDHETTLLAGQSWPNCGSLPAAASTASPTAATTVKTPATDLAAQNDAFAAALAKKRSGDRDGAIAAFSQLLARWPNSAHAETAAAERMRLAAGPQAVHYAKAYLARFPNGFAAKEARTIASMP